ncbi:hypothetical protein, partial [Plasmodium yoelii yoelii]
MLWIRIGVVFVEFIFLF